MTHVFISFSSRNIAEAKLFLDTLEAVNIRCWMAPRDIPPGKPWAGAINRAIKECSVFLLMLTEDSNSSNQVLNEVVLASQHKKPIVACFLQELELSDDLGYYLTSLHWLDASSLPLSAHLPGLVMTVRNLLQTNGGMSIPAEIVEIPFNPAPPPSEPAAGVTRRREKDGMLEVYVPSGEFWMGSNDGAVDEKPPHTVHLDAYWIDQTPVTNAMFAQFLNDRGNRKQNGVNWYVLERGRIRLAGKIWRVEKGFEQHPVVSVNWYGARAYCEWVGSRMPTEAEWEKAARGTDGSSYPWGSREPDASLANFHKNIGTTTPVGSYPAGSSPFGALDMAGNVWEWCADWYGKAYYGVSPAANPTGPRGGTDRVVRGGSWKDAANWLRGACRSGGRSASRINYCGFRCARPA